MERKTSLRHQTEDRVEGSRAKEKRLLLPFSSHAIRPDTGDDERSADGSISAEGHSGGEIGHLANSEEHTGLSSSEKTVKPLTPEALATFNISQARSGVVYISRIPPGMQPAKVRHLLSQYGEVGRVYLQREDAKSAYLRRKYTTTKKAHFVEGWVEFKDKRVARSVAGMLNAQPIGGKKGTRWRDDVWTMKYLPKFKWNMLTEQIAHEAALHAARLRVELAQSKTEQHEYLRNVELARVLDKRNEKRREKGQEPVELRRPRGDEGGRQTKRQKTTDSAMVESVLESIF